MPSIKSCRPLMVWACFTKSAALCVLSATLVCQSSSTAWADLIVGPFVSGSGSWTSIANGGFETGSVADWSIISNQPNSIWSASGSLPFIGTYSARSTTNTSFSVGGFGIGKAVSGLQIGQEYVLSAFFNTSQANGGATYLDLGDSLGEVEPGASPGSSLFYGITEWQFAYATFTATQSDYTVRLVRDGRFGSVNANETVYVDEIAITPLNQFIAPTAVPEPSSALLLGVALPLLSLGRFSKSVRRRFYALY